LRSNKGASFALVSSLPSPKFELALSLPLYLEYMDVLSRPDVKPKEITNEDISDLVVDIAKSAHLQDIYFLWRPWLKDQKDYMVLELAIAAQCSYIVTFNVKDFSDIESLGIKVISLSDFLEIVRSL
jgi:predicted nucleic acid-binding protein